MQHPRAAAGRSLLTAAAAELRALAQGVYVEVLLSTAIFDRYNQETAKAGRDVSTSSQL